MLEEVFAVNPWPDKSLKGRLSKDLNVDPTRLCKWFYNKRIKEDINRGKVSLFYNACVVFKCFIITVQTNMLNGIGAGAVSMPLHCTSLA